jgi:hypothetical protein
MSLEKSEILHAAFDSHAVELEKLRLVAEQRIQQASGASSALKKAAKHIHGLIPLIKKGIDDGEIVPSSEPVEFLKVLVTWVSRAGNTCVAMSEMADSEGNRAEGEIRGYDLSIGIAKSRATEAATRAAEKAEVLSEGVGEGIGQKDDRNVIPLRPTGTRPARSDADLRKSEETKKPIQKRRKKTKVEKSTDEK